MKPRPLLILALFNLVIVLLAVVLTLYFSRRAFRHKPIEISVSQETKEVPPFFDSIWREEDMTANEFLIPDPVVSQRQDPLMPDQYIMGPNDFLGFRNRFVPNYADMITIGDSQTYGNNVRFHDCWPAVLGRHFSQNYFAEVYNISSAGWGALQYLYFLRKAVVFKPRVMIVALYSGNDWLDAFQLAYSTERWQEYRLDSHLRIQDYPAIQYPTKENDSWPVRFEKGPQLTFSPRYRLGFNDRSNAAVRAGLEITKRALKAMDRTGADIPAKIIVTIIPTKEMVYSRRLGQEGISLPDKFRELLANETQNIQEIQEVISHSQHLQYVSLIEPLMEAAFSEKKLYLPNENGHPIERGYQLIALTLAPTIKELLIPDPNGPVTVQINRDKKFRGYLRHHTVFILPNDTRKSCFEGGDGKKVIPQEVLSSWGFLYAEDRPHLDLCRATREEENP